MNQLPYKVSICGKHEVNNFAGEGITHLLSLEDPGTPKRTPSWLRGEHLQIHFHDLDSPSHELVPCGVIPNREHVAQILRFGDRCRHSSNEGPVHLLVHCFAGVSRSPAAAFALVTQSVGSADALEAIWFVEGRRPGCVPNRLIVELADGVLSEKGELVHALALFRRSLGFD